MNLKKELRSYLSKRGYRLTWHPDRVEKEISRVMGKERYSEFCNCADDMREGLEPIGSMYDFIETDKLANLLFSHQGDLVCESHLKVLEDVIKRAHGKISIADLGCWSGCLASFIGTKLPESKIVGFDRLERMVQIAEANKSSENCRFEQWDYTGEHTALSSEFDVLYSLIGIEQLFDHFDNWGPSLSQIRTSEGYKRVRDNVSKYTRAWRGIAKQHAALFTMLRIPALEVFIPVIDAFAVSGWSWLPSESFKIKADSEILPYLAFQATDNQSTCCDISPEQLALWFEEDRVSQLISDTAFDQSPRLMGEFFLRGASIQMEKTRDYESDGHTKVASLGINYPFVFLFVRATTGYAKLQIGPMTQKEDFERQFEELNL